MLYVQTQVPQIRPLADIVHSKYSLTYLLTYLHRKKTVDSVRVVS